MNEESDLIARVRALVSKQQMRVSEHGYDELSNDQIRMRDVIQGVQDATVIEEYPRYPKGPCLLALQNDAEGRPVHVVWGIPRGHDGPAVVVTAYRPNPERWDGTFTRRKP